jgi:mono/diheme cytochrome c family protein
LPPCAASRQAAVYQQQCARCHTAYSTQGLLGPSLFGVFRKPYLPSGAPANDERVTSVVLHGRDMMPSFANAMDADQLQALLKYLHTL